MSYTNEDIKDEASINTQDDVEQDEDSSENEEFESDPENEEFESEAEKEEEVENNEEELDLYRPLTVDPFRHRIKMSRLRWIRTYVLTIFLVPFRVLGIISMTLLSWLLSSIALAGLDDEQKNSRPFTGWRKNFQIMASMLGRVAFFCSGFHSVTIKGARADPKDVPILVIAPHSSFIDGFVIFWTGLPYIVSRNENRFIPFFGKCVELTQAIHVSREVPDSRQKTVKEIIRRTGEPGWSQLVIFPEGSTSNRSALMSFKPGAFYPGKPVQPVLIRYPNKTDTVTWTWDQTHGAKSVAWLTLAQPYSRAEIEYLAPIYPSQEEKDDPKLFASNVRKVMARALKVPLCDASFENIKEQYGHLYKNKKKKKKTL